MTLARCTFGVFGHDEHRTPVRVATFFTFDDATDFVHANLGIRNLYLSAPQYDRRTSGYRPVEKPSGYEAWLAEVDARRDAERRAA